MLEKKVMPPRKAALTQAQSAKPSNPFAIFAESDTEDEVIETTDSVVEKKPENRFESIVKEEVHSVPPFTQQKGRWMKARVEEGWISLRPRPEHEKAAIAAAGIEQSIVSVDTTHAEDQPRSAHEWAERVRQSLEKAEAIPRVERLKDIRESLTRLSFFRRPIEHLVAKEETSATTVDA